MLEKDSGLPYYLQIYDELRKRIISKDFLPGQLIPSENFLVDEFGVTRATVRNAIKKLQSEGLIVTEKGKGSFVNSPKIEQSLFKFYSFGREHHELSKNTELLGVEIMEDEEIQKTLHLSENQKVTRITRIRKMDKVPVILEKSYIPSDLVPQIEVCDLANSSIYDLLEVKYNRQILRAKEYLETCVTDSMVSGLLAVLEGTPVFWVKRITFDISERPIEFRESIIRSDKFTFSVDLKLR